MLKHTEGVFGNFPNQEVQMKLLGRLLALPLKKTSNLSKLPTSQCTMLSLYIYLDLNGHTNYILQRLKHEACVPICAPRKSSLSL